MSSRASLNHIYRTVWNEALGAMVAVAEIDSSGGRTAGARIRSADLQQPVGTRLGMLALLVALVWGVVAPQALANPTGGVAVAGQATFVNNGNKLLVTTQNAAGQNFSAINWQSFSIPTGSSTYFAQPTANSTSINRVVTNTPSQIFGTLSSNGNLVLVNQAGIAVGTGAVVDTNGFTASSLAMSDADAMAGRLRFGDGQIGTSAVSVNGSILARNGDAVLIGSNVNTGVDALIQAPNGSTILAAGQQVEITGRGLEGIRLQVQAPADSAVNLGTLSGDAVGMFAGTLRHSGLIQATTATLEGGRVVLKSSGDAYVEGGGRIVATGVTGGSVDVLGQRVAVLDNASIDVSGQNGGGSIRVGGDYQGNNAAISNASMTYLGEGATLRADALNQGSGGRVIVWADDVNRAYGSVSARGGAASGDGGFVETSGKHYLDFQGKVDTRAPNGAAGTLLLDPADITIATGTNDIAISGSTPFVGVGTSGPSTLSASTLIGALANGDVIVDASGGSGGTGNINVAAAVTWANPHQLTLQSSAAGGITLNANLQGGSGSTVKLDAGNGGVSTAGGVSIIADALQVISVGSVNLGSNNAVGTIAAAVSGGGFAYEGDGGFTIGSVGGTNGISATGNITVRNYTSGTLTVSNNVDAGGSEILIGQASGYGGMVVGSGATLTGNRVQLYVSNSATISSQGNMTGGDAGVDLTAPGGITLTGGAIQANSGGQITLTANNGQVSQSAGNTLTANDLSVSAGGIISLTAGTNTVSNVSLATSIGTMPISYWSTGALNLTGVTAGGDLNIKTVDNSDISQSGSISGATGYAVNINAGSGNIVLGDNNALGSTNVTLTGSAITVYSNSGLNVVALNRTGTHGLDLQTSVGALTVPSGAINTGTEDLTLWGITSGLSTTGDLSGANISLKGSSVQLNNNVTATGNVRLEAVSNNVAQQVTTSPPYIHANSLEAIASGSITLNSSGNQLSTVAAYAYGGSVSLTNGIPLAVDYVGNTYGIEASGSITLNNTGSITLNEGLYGSGVTVTSTGAIIQGSGGYFDSSKGYGGDISLNATAIGASGGTDGYGNSVVVYPGSGKFIATASAGDVHAYSASGTFNVGTVSASGTVHLTADSSMTIKGTVTGSGTGDSVQLVVPYGTLTVQSGYGNIVAPNGRWLVYSDDGYGSSVYLNGVVSPAFKQYGTSFGDTIKGSGSGIVYANSPSVSGTLAGSVTKIYDGASSIDLSGASISGASASNSDDLSVATLAGGSGTLADVNVGTGIAVTADYLKFTGVAAPEGSGLTVYYLSQSLMGVSGAIGAVTPARAIATINGTGTRVYDGTNIVNASIFTLSGLVGGETLALSGSGTVDNKNVGANKTVTMGSLALGDGTGLASNYTLSGGTWVASITPLAITSISGVTIDPRVYDGTLTASVSPSGAVFGGAIAGDVLGLSGTGTYLDRHAGVGKSATVTNLSLSGSDAGNYTIAPALTSTTATGTVTPLAITSVSGITATKVYDGKTGTAINVSGAKIDGAIAGDNVTLAGTGTGNFADRNVGTGKTLTVNVTGLSLAGADAGDYTLSPTLTSSASTGTITQLASVAWSGGNSGSWNSESNWAGGALPDGSNVASVTVPAGTTVTYDGGTTQVSSLSGGGNLAISGGSLSVGSATSLAQYTQSGGSYSSGGGLTVNGSYNQSGGSVSLGGALSATQTTGNLVVGTLSAPSATLTATSGSISQSGPLTVGSLTTQSTAGTTLDNAGNHISAFKGTNTGSGGISVTTVGPVDLQGITTTNGDIKVLNFGGITSNAPIGAVGSVTLTANSPLTINSSVNATGNIALVATNQTSEGNVTINGKVSSSGGSIAVAAASNYVQNGTISAAQGVTATAGGTMTFGPEAITTGHPVNFEAAGTTVIPPGSTPTVGSTPTDFVATFMSNFEDALIAQNTGDPNDKKKDKDVVVEGQSCTR